MLSLISLVITTNPILSKISASEVKIKEIIKKIAVLYPFHPLETTNLLANLAKFDPRLIVKLLAEKLCLSSVFEERSRLIQAIA
jgi:hypothetical protein